MFKWFLRRDRYTDVLLKKPVYCRYCGDDLVATPTGYFDEYTGQPETRFDCPQNCYNRRYNQPIGQAGGNAYNDLVAWQPLPGGDD